ncbi:FtsX-like permease family protein [Alteromonadaceae bacterium M269]|nr:FtsX-like permease family protein [Alteromonadaceae bacterium M269]
MIALSLAWQHFWQQTKSSESRLWLMSQFFLSFYLLFITLGSSSIQTYLKQNVQQLLGAGAVVISQSTPDVQFRQQLKGFAHRYSESQVFELTLTHNEKWQTVQVKAVDAQYPIRGHLKTSYELGGPESATQSGPKPGFIWLDSRTISALQIKPGESITLGSHALRVDTVLVYEPDRLLEGHSVAMRAMINASDLSRIDIPSNVTYRFLLDANLTQQQDLENWLSTNHPQMKVISDHNGRHPLAAIWKRVENFLGLSGVLLFLLGALCIDMTRQQLQRQQSEFVAIAMSCGMTRWQSLLVTVWHFVLALLFTLGPAFIIAWATEQLAIRQLISLFPGLASNWQFEDALRVIVICAALFVCLQLPNWMLMLNTRVTALLQSHQPKLSNKVVRILLPIISLSLLSWFYTDNSLLTAMLLTALAVCLFIMICVMWFLLFGLGKVAGAANNLLSFTFYLLRTRLLSKSAQIIALGFCLTLLIFSLRLAEDFTQMLTSVSRHQDGNLFISQATSEDIKALESWATQTNSEIRHLRPFTYAEVTHINDKTLKQHSKGPSDSMSTLQNAVRLSWSQETPSNNRLVDGNWSTQDKSIIPVSVEAEVAQDMKLKIGDELTFLVEGQNHILTIQSLHEFKPGSHSMTFWFVIPLSGHHDLPFFEKPLFMGSMEIHDNAWNKLSHIWSAHPAMRMVSLQEITHRLDKFTQLSKGAIIVFSTFIIFMAGLVIFASARRYADEDKKRNGLILSFGLTQASCIRIVCYEWLTTALVVGLSACLSAWLAGELIYQVQFDLHYNFDFVWMTILVVSLAIALILLGLFISKNSLRASVLDLIYERKPSLDSIKKVKNKALSHQPIHSHSGE